MVGVRVEVSWECLDWIYVARIYFGFHVIFIVRWNGVSGIHLCIAAQAHLIIP